MPDTQVTDEGAVDINGYLDVLATARQAFNELELVRLRAALAARAICDHFECPGYRVGTEAPAGPYAQPVADAARYLSVYVEHDGWGSCYESGFVADEIDAIVDLATASIRGDPESRLSSRALGVVAMSTPHQEGTREAGAAV